MRKKAHVVKDNKGNEFPNHVIFFDTETTEHNIDEKTRELRLRFGCAAYWRVGKKGRPDTYEWITFHDAKTFWDFVEKHAYDRQKLFLVAHNITFDMKVTDGFRALQNREFKLCKLINTGTRNIWKFKRDKRVITCLDNMNFFNSSLSALGESMKIPKIEMPSMDAPFNEWRIYCRRDVEVMTKAWRVWYEFLRENDLGNFSQTLASQSFAAFRHRFMPVPICIHTNPHAVALEREAYHGGRTEAFYIGVLPEATYYYMDVNSMYPSVMQTEEYPRKLIGFRRNISTKMLGKLLEDYCIIARVTLDTHENAFSTVYNNRLVFPVGRFVTTLSTRELRYALENGFIAAIDEVAIYEKAILFRDYVDFFYTSRMKYKKEGNAEFAQCCKLMLNCLYGKFGQRQEVYTKVKDVESDEVKMWTEFDLTDNKFHSYRLLNRVLEEKTGFEEGFNSFVAVAAHVSADARMKLWEYMKKVGLNNVYYVDTDSIFTNETGYRNATLFLRDGELGYLSVKRSDTTLAIYGAKDYKFGSDQVIKGIRKGAAYLGDNRYKQDKFQGLLGAWRAGRLDRQIIQSVEKKLSRIYHKGVVAGNGLVAPFHLETPTP